jgi:hypothetical protein
LFGSIGCANCHATSAADQRAAAKIVSAIGPKAAEKGCLAQDATQRGKAPDFGLEKQERAALLDFLATDRMSLARETPAEFSRRQVQSLNCAACHRRDGAQSVLAGVITEEGSQGFAPEILPSLTWAGEKLYPAWTQKLLAGEHDHRARHWLKARMPSFGARAKLLAVGLSHEHGFAAEEPPKPAANERLAEIGQRLIGDREGLACSKCHAIGSAAALAPFEAPGINLVDAGRRLRHAYYLRWMMDPPRVDISTKMPKFAIDGKKTGAAAILEGDARRQYDALWHYIQTLRQN